MPKSWDLQRYAHGIASGWTSGSKSIIRRWRVVSQVAIQGPFDHEAGVYLPEWQLQVRWLEKLPLGSAFASVVRRTVAIHCDPALLSGGDPVRFIAPTKPDIVLDSTGVGSPLREMFMTQHKTPTIPVIITGGVVVNQNANGYRVPKADLVAALSVEFELARIKIASGLDLSDDLLGELRNFRMETSAATGRTRLRAAAGHHDDLLIATALATWWLTSQRSQHVGTARIVMGDDMDTEREQHLREQIIGAYQQQLKRTERHTRLEKRWQQRQKVPGEGTKEEAHGAQRDRRTTPATSAVDHPERS